MQRLFFPICTVLLVFIYSAGFTQEKIKTKDDKMKMKGDNEKMKIKGMDMSLPYTANYSSNFSIGNPSHAKMILDLWKDWDDNAFDRHNYFADTVVMFLPNGMVVKGKDSCLAGAKRFRGSLSSSVSTLDAWTPLKSNDKNENWVALWGTETDTYADGKVDKRDLHEIWRINKDGKVDFMKQFTATPAPQQ